jgi:hypothetical protein
MTNLMQQLQAWANQGLIVFPEGDYKGGLNVPIESLSPYGGKPEWKCTKDAWKLYHDRWVHTFGGYLQLVLDGTIQVWRPVDKYEPPNSKEDFLISVIYKIGIDGRTKRGYRKGRIGFAKNLGTWHFKDGKGDLELDSIATHYQPLPQPPQEVSHV